MLQYMWLQLLRLRLLLLHLLRWLLLQLLRWLLLQWLHLLLLRRARHIPPITLVPEIYIRNLKNRLLGENLLRKNLLSRPFLPDSSLSLSLSLSLLLSNPFSLCGLLRL